MINEILTDELYRASRKIEAKLNKAPFNEAQFCILSSGDSFSSFIKDAFGGSTLADRTVFTTDQLIKKSAQLIYFVNCKDPRYNEEKHRSALIEKIKEALNIVKDRPGFALILPLIIDFPEALPNGTTAIAEREYDCFLANKAKSAAENLYLEIEELCRSYTKAGANAIILRFTGIYGPGIELFSEFSFEDFVLKANQDKAVTITQADALKYYSPCYIQDAISALIGAIASKNYGNIYNAASRSFSIKEFKLAYQHSLSNELGLNAQIAGVPQPRHHCLSALKLAKYASFNENSLEEAAHRIGAYYLERDYNILRCMPDFEGRLDRLKGLQMELLKEIDAICKENNIQYFLAGGSLLGAIRHHSIIPWDDDLDIGMLRKDFEKFRSICPKMLSEKYTYESPAFSKDNHYYFDKIRLSDTYLTTTFSDNFKIKNGVFLDIVCYDQTGNSRALTKLQIKTITTAIRFINMKWYNQPRSKGHAKAAKLLFPLIRLLPFSFLHSIFEGAVRFYAKKKNAKYLIDGMGLNIRKGPFLKEWVDAVEYAEFGDFKAPIPVGHQSYLEHLYGKNYMDLPPISKRCSHSLTRIDLGGYLTGNTPSHRVLHLDGELFE